MTAFARVSTQIFRRTSSQYSITACCCRRGTYLNPQRSMMIHPLLRYSSSSHHWSDVEDWFSLRDALVRSHPLKYAPAKVDGVTSYKGKGPVKLDEDWHDLIDTVGSFGTPEVADQISGAYYMTVTPFEDYSAKCYRLRDDIQLLTNGQLILLTKLLVRHWDQTKIRDSGIVQVFILELDGVLRKKGDSFPEREQLTLALSMGAFHYLDGIRFPSKILNNILLNFKGENSGKEAIVLILLLASCCRRNTAKENCFTERAIIMEEKLLAIFEKLNHSELAVSFQGLQTLSDGSAGLKLKLLTEARHGFRM